MLSDTDILANLGSGIIIDPFERAYLSPIGYDLRIGHWAVSLRHRMEYTLDETRGVLIDPGDTVVIETLEELTLSKDFGATLHSMVTLLSEGGISHISTTIDPTHEGKLLVQFHNQSEARFPLQYGHPFCTICFHKMDSPATKETRHERGRYRLKDRLRQHIIERAIQIESYRSPTIFVGHGHNEQWRRLMDLLRDEHGYTVSSFETHSTAGYGTREVLDDMLKESSFAILVMTREDRTAEGQVSPGRNVLHELGLFQGRLGWHRAIIVAEEGVELPSNLKGDVLVRFPKGQIENAMSKVLAAIEREFPK